MREMFLKPNVLAEPLVCQWYAWAHLLQPATAGCNIVSRHLSIMKSFAQALSYDYHADLPRYTYSDLPDRIDYVVITHNHQDHVLLETLLQLRHQIGTVIVLALRTAHHPAPRSQNRSFAPSLGLELRAWDRHRRPLPLPRSLRLRHGYGALAQIHHGERLHTRL